MLSILVSFAQGLFVLLSFHKPKIMKKLLGISAVQTGIFLFLLMVMLLGDSFWLEWRICGDRDGIESDYCYLFPIF